jgi:hypothetical protein
MNEMTSSGQRDASPRKRPELLTILCILSFIGSGLAAFSNLVLFLTFEEMDTLLEEAEIEMEEIMILLSGGRSFFVAGFFLYMVSLAGIYSMWRMRKIGFHLYTAAQLFLIILPVVSIPDFPFSLAGVLVTAAFIFGYATQLKFMS